MRPSLLFVIPPLVILAACGTDEGPIASNDPSAVPGSPGADADTVYTGTGTVLENKEHGPELCLGGVMLSDPPQCSGVPINNWSWDDVDGSESRAGITWGVYVVTGRYDGKTFTPTEPAQPPSNAAAPATNMDPSTPCEPPDGGWAVVDPDKTSDETLAAVMERAPGLADYAGTWLDQSINPMYRELTDPSSDMPAVEIEMAMNDPTKLILNVRFTAELDRHEAELRNIWGGALCVSQAEHTYAELRAIQDEVSMLPGTLGSWVDNRAGMVELEVIVDDGLQARLDEKYGPGVVRVHPHLRPVEP